MAGMLKRMFAAGSRFSDPPQSSGRRRAVSFGKDINLPLSGAAKPEHREIAKRQQAATPRPNPAAERANMDQGKKKGIFANLMDKFSAKSPINRAANAAHKK